ncbi:MAG: U32 family peptidase [Oscillospiraceae bacterium]|nr:U32 family peptidase [Oscillospiraceae bacterium]
MLELLSPAGSPDALVAAVQNGADAVYLGLDAFNARRGAKNFTEDSFGAAAEYCRVRGCKVYVTLNVLATDREFGPVELLAKTVSRLGADALIVQDLGMMRMLRQALPDMPLHASTQMSVHNLDGVRRAAEAGASRVILARELSIAHIAYIAKQSPIELEVFVHGALCVSYSGQCYMSAVIGGRSGNRGMCAQPCRLPYTLDGTPGAHLSLKDYSLVEHLAALEKCGVTCVKIEGRMKRPEYTAIATRVYSDAIREERLPSDDELSRLAAVFSRQGFTDAYLRGEKGPDMMGIRTEENKRQFRLFADAKKTYIDVETPRLPVKFYAMIQRGRPAKLAVSDTDSHVARVEGPVPAQAEMREMDRAFIEGQLAKTGGTPYFCQDIEVVLDAGLHLSSADINEMRRTLLEELTALRKQVPYHSEGLFRAGDPAPKREVPPQLNVSLLRASQLTEEFADLKPSLIYLPIDEILEHTKELRPYLERDDLHFAPILPRVVWDNEKDTIKRKLFEVQEFGITECLVGNMGHIGLCRKSGLQVRGDFGFNVFNGQTLKVCGEMGLLSATASFELNLAQIRDMDKPIDLELLAYGRLPLMITEACIMHNVRDCQHVCEPGAHLKDRRGAEFPLVKEAGCRNIVLNSRKLWLADRAGDYMDIGLWGVRLCFTTENSRECREVLERYLCMGNYEPGEFTRGLYYRGVE